MQAKHATKPDKACKHSVASKFLKDSMQAEHAKLGDRCRSIPEEPAV